MFIIYIIYFIIIDFVIFFVLEISFYINCKIILDTIDFLFQITFVQELLNNEKKMNMLLVGCSSKSFGILFVCRLPTLMIIRCIHTPSPVC